MVREWISRMTVPVRIALGTLIVSGAFFLVFIFFAVHSSQPYALISGESISNWNFKGAYQDGGVHQAAVEKEIVRLKSLLGTGSNDYELLVGIASQFVLLGDGKSAYLYYSKAIDTNPKKGLSYFNMGRLMEQEGAIETARAAYIQAVTVEPNTPDFRSYLAVFTKAHPQAK